MVKVMVFGTFDILHDGHLHMLREARALGDQLVVVIGRDATVKKVKGEHPLHNENDRLAAVEKTHIADKVRLGNLEDQHAVIEEEQPNSIALGYDQEAFTEKLVEKYGATLKIVRLQAFHPEKYKSSLLKKQAL